MSATDRENRLLVAENWTKIYQSFRNAEFQSYDFENLRRTMISYLRQNYPEDFNDYIESSEYLALIDLIAFLGQNIAFRVDLNARENFLELAERRESVLRLARTISYNAKRNTAAKGLLKITTIQTTESVLDSNGRNLAGQVITWNDPSNTNWYEQFIKIINAAFPTAQQFGKPSARDTIYGIPTEQYRFNASNTDVPVYGFTKVVSGSSMSFEVTSTTFSGQNYIYEEAPKVGNSIACVYRNDGQGSGSPNSGFFFNFTQGLLNTGTFNISQPIKNETIDINTQNINETDVWLYGLDVNGVESTTWTKVPSLSGNSVIYNSINNNTKDIYGVITRAGDAISLTFSDGAFGNLPQGNFRVYYRISNGLNYAINPQDIRNVTMDIPYISSVGQNHTLTLSLALTTSVMNSSSTESNESIKTNAPQNYYTQNRMITGEDYNISPLTSSQQVVKIKSINRTSSGISRYFDLKDPTGKYSSTTLYSDDGVIYTENYTPAITFNYVEKIDIQEFLYNRFNEILLHEDLKNFYYANFMIDIALSGISVSWNNSTSDVNSSSGTLTLNTSYSSDIDNIKVGSLVKFNSPIGYYFDTNNNNKLVNGSPLSDGCSYYIWAKVINITVGTSQATTVYTINKVIPSSTVKPTISKIIPKWNTTISASTIATITDLIYTKQQFGLRYDVTTTAWKIITSSNLNITGSFDRINQGSETNTKNDSSWLISFTRSNENYVVTSREKRYIFESDAQLRFYFDSNSKIYNSKTTKVVNDLITVLGINSNPADISIIVSVDSYSPTVLKVFNPQSITIGMVADHPNIPANTIITDITKDNITSITSIKISNGFTSNFDVTRPVSFKYPGTSSYTQDFKWAITDNYIGTDGYVDTKKVIISFFDSDVNGIVDDPELFNYLVPSLNTYVVQERYSISSGQEDYRYISNDGDMVVTILTSQSALDNINQYTDGQYFYFIDTNVVKKLNKSTSEYITSLDYKVYVGRDKIKFKHSHAADYDSRIDPGTTNIMDLFILTRDYDISFRQWINGSISTKPLPPSSVELSNTLSPSLNLIKSVSDEVVYHPVSYTVLFGSKAIPELQATFKVIKNPEQVISDNEVKSRIVTAINQFFAIENWNFGDSFYFSELSAYVISKLAPYVVSFVIVPLKTDLNFGNLFEIHANNDQLFINGATVDNIEIIQGITNTNIKSIANTIQTNSVLSQQAITSSPYGSL